MRQILEREEKLKKEQEALLQKKKVLQKKRQAQQAKERRGQIFSLGLFMEQYFIKERTKEEINFFMNILINKDIISREIDKTRAYQCLENIREKAKSKKEVEEEKNS